MEACCFLLMGACLAPSYSPDGAAGEHKFNALKPVFILDGKGGGVCVMYDVCFLASEAFGCVLFLKND